MSEIVDTIEEELPLNNLEDEPVPEQNDDVEDDSVPEQSSILDAIKDYMSLAVQVVSIWYFGYSRCPLVWLLVPLGFYVYSEARLEAKRKRTKLLQEIAKDEQAFALSLGKALPSWVKFPEVQRVEWMNKILNQLWPFIAEHVTIILRTQVEKSVIANLPKSLKSFKFSKVDLGDRPPRISGVQVFDKMRNDEMKMDIEIGYNSDVHINVSIKGIDSGIRDLSVHGTLRVIMKPLLNEIPLVGGLQVFFLNPPEIHFDMTGLTNLLDLPFINDKLTSVIEDVISGILVLPHRFPIKLSDRVNLNRLRYPPPQGVIRVSIIEAKGIIKADLGGRCKSDPYVVIKLGATSKKTKVLDNKVNPVWNETFEICVDEAVGQNMFLFVFDSDSTGKDDFCGRTSMSLASLREDGIRDTWLPLEGVKSGVLHVRVQWLWLADDPRELNRVIQKIPKGKKGKYTNSSAIVMCFLDSAWNIPRTPSKVSYRCELTVGTERMKSSVYTGNDDPKWEQSFRFLIFNPRVQFLEVRLVNHKTKEIIGKTTVKLKNILSEPNMLVNKKFRIVHPGSFIIMRLCIRILTPRASPEWLKIQPDLMDAIDPEELVGRLSADSFYVQK